MVKVESESTKRMLEFFGFVVGGMQERGVGVK
jgi:hypothetical protein